MVEIICVRKKTYLSKNKKEVGYLYPNGDVLKFKVGLFFFLCGLFLKENNCEHLACILE